jgi:hypothetical protein
VRRRQRTANHVAYVHVRRERGRIVAATIAPYQTLQGDWELLTQSRPCFARDVARRSLWLALETEHPEVAELLLEQAG